MAARRNRRRGAAPSLARQLGHRDERVRVGAAEALARLGPADPALPRRDADEINRRLAAAAADRSPRVRAKVLLAYGSRGRAQDLPRIVAGFNDPHPGVRAAVAAAMRHRDRTEVPGQRSGTTDSPADPTDAVLQVKR